MLFILGTDFHCLKFMQIGEPDWGVPTLPVWSASISTFLSLSCSVLFYLNFSYRVFKVFNEAGSSVFFLSNSCIFWNCGCCCTIVVVLVELTRPGHGWAHFDASEQYAGADDMQVDMQSALLHLICRARGCVVFYGACTHPVLGAASGLHYFSLQCIRSQQEQPLDVIEGWRS